MGDECDMVCVENLQSPNRPRQHHLPRYITDYRGIDMLENN